MRSTPVIAGLPSPFTFLFDRTIRALLPQMNREPINFNADDECYDAQKTCLDNYIKGSYTQKYAFSFHVGSTAAVIALRWWIKDMWCGGGCSWH